MKCNRVIETTTAGILCAMIAFAANAQWQQEEQQGQEQQGQQFQTQPQQLRQQQPESQRDELGRRMQELETRSREIDIKLERIVDEANAMNPAILEKRTALLEKFEEKLEDYGYPDDRELEELQGMQQKLQNPGDMEDRERNELIADFQDGVERIQQARERAQLDPEVQRLQEDFIEERLESMMEVDENAEALEREQEAIIREFSQLREQLQQVIQQEHMRQQPQ